MKRAILYIYILTCALIPAGFSSVNAQGVGLEWAKRMGGRGYDYGNAVAVDAERNVYVTGYFNDTSDFGLASGSIISKGGQDIFVTKHDAAGNVIWMRQFGGAGSDAGNDLVLDSVGNIYVTGAFSETVSFDPNNKAYDLTSYGQTDIFVCKLRNDGSLVWAAQMGSADGPDEGGGIALDGEGNIYTTGVFYGTADFNPGASSNTLNAAGSSDIFVSKLNNNGEYVWAGGMGGTRLDRGEKIAVDRWGYVYTTGQFQRQADFDPGPNPYNMTSGSNSYDVFISKLDKDGNFVWAKQFTGPNPAMGTSIALDHNANVYTTGNFNGGIDFDPGTGVEMLNSAGAADIFVSKLDSAGNYLWAAGMGGASAWGDRGYAIAVDGTGNAFVTGFFSDSVDFDPGIEEYKLYAKSSDIFVTKLDSSGRFKWAKQFVGGASQDWGIGITVDGSGNVYSSGMFNNTVDFDPDTNNADLTAAGGSDIYVYKLICTDTTSSVINMLACTEYTFFDSTYTEEGTYYHILPNGAGCDSTIALVLELKDAEAHITVREFTLSTTEPFESYQWFLNGVPIEGATDSIYQVKENGDYTVAVVNERGCTDTSDVYRVSNVPTGGITVPAWAEEIRVFPNPVQLVLHFTSPVPLYATVFAMDGRELIKGGNNHQIDVSALGAGLYLLQLSDKNGRVLRVEKFSKITGW